MKKVALLLMAVIFCSLSAWCQKTLPIFTTTNELFNVHVSSVSDAIPILKKHGFATNQSWSIENSPNSSSAQIIKSVIRDDDYGTIVVEVTYDRNESRSNLYAVSYTITGSYENIFNQYLKKNGYAYLGEERAFPWSKIYKGKHACSVTSITDGALAIMFINLR